MPTKSGKQIILSTEPPPQKDVKIYPRELEIIKLLAAGKRNKEIGKILKVSERTIQSHLSVLYTKTETLDRTSLIVLMLKDKLLKLEEIDV